MIDPRYKSPMYRGPELDGLTTDEAFDLAKQSRIALRNKLMSERLAAERMRGHRAVAFWGIAGGIALIVGGLYATMWLLGAFE